MTEQVIKIKELDPEIIPPLSERLGDPSYMGGSKIVIVGKPGCFSRGTPVRMFDGSWKPVEAIEVGDRLMGDDNTVRQVLELCRGHEQMFTIQPSTTFEAFEPYTVNLKHKLVLWQTPNDKETALEITVENFLKLDQTRTWYIQRVPIQFPEKPTYVDPYDCGLTASGRDLQILTQIRTNAICVRLEFLAGLLDASSHVFGHPTSSTSVTFETDLIDLLPTLEIVDLVRSLGLGCKIVEPHEIVLHKHKNLIGCTLQISGNIWEIPSRKYHNQLYSLSSKTGNNITSGILNSFSTFSVTSKGKGDYYGFTLDQNHRFLLASGDIVRNTGKTFLIRSLLYAKKHVYPVALVFSGSEDTNHAFSKFIPSTFIYNKYDEDKIKDFINRQKLAAKHLQNPWAVQIIDDCADNPKIFNGQVQNFLFKNGRHYYFTYILSLQYAMDIRPQIRTLIDGVFILRETIGLNREKLYKNYASIIPTYKIFCAIMDQLTDNYCAIYIHNATTSNNWQDCVFYWKAKAPPDGWKLGCPEYWEFHNARYNPEYVDPVMI